MQKSSVLQKAFSNDDKHDIFKYDAPDEYFGDYEETGSWNNTPASWNMSPSFT